MTRPFRTMMFTLAAAMIAFGAVAANAQAPKKAPDYKISSIAVNAFDEAAGTMSDAAPPNAEPRSFFNDLSTSLFVWVVIRGEVGSFEAGRMANVTVTEGKKIKTTRKVQIGLIGSDGNYFVPVFVYGPLCSNVTITATITGQKTVQSKKARIPFLCGE